MEFVCDKTHKGQHIESTDGGGEGGEEGRGMTTRDNKGWSQGQGQQRGQWGKTRDIEEDEDKGQWEITQQ